MPLQGTLTLSPYVTLSAELNRALADSDDDPLESVKDTAWLLYDTALMQSGFAQDDVDAFAARMYRTMKGALNLDTLEVSFLLCVNRNNLLLFYFSRIFKA